MKQFFTENNDRLSMKRLCGFACTIALCIKVVHAPTDALIYTVGGIAAAEYRDWETDRKSTRLNSSHRL